MIVTARYLLTGAAFSRHHHQGNDATQFSGGGGGEREGGARSFGVRKGEGGEGQVRRDGGSAALLAAGCDVVRSRDR